MDNADSMAALYTCQSTQLAGRTYLESRTMKTSIYVIIIAVIVIGMIAMLVQPLFAAGTRNVGLYYAGRYFVVMDAEGYATVIDLEQAKCRKVRSDCGDFLKLDDVNWSSGLRCSGVN